MGIDQRLTRLEHGARQPRLAMESDGHANTKTQRRTESAATAVQAMRRDSCTAEQKVQDGPKTLITFGVEAEPPTAAGGLLPTDEASTATRTTSNERLRRFYATEKMIPEEDSKKENPWTSIPSACYDSSFWRLLVAPYCRRR